MQELETYHIAVHRFQEGDVVIQEHQHFLDGYLWPGDKELRTQELSMTMGKIVANCQKCSEALGGYDLFIGNCCQSADKVWYE